jgi:hypothetical protein
MRTLVYSYPTKRPEGPFTVQFEWAPMPLEEVASFARQTMDVVKLANRKLGFGLDEETLRLMTVDFQEFVIKAWAADVAEGLIGDSVNRAISGVVGYVDRISRMAINA